MSDLYELFSEIPQRKKRTMAELYPGFTKQEQLEAEETLRRYARLVWRIFKRVKRENPRLLTKLLKQARLKELKNQSSPSEISSQ